ncbi:ATP-binding cassette domain-containing protein [Geofilum rubicundum]|uniref:ABC transporter n=1 Tax=Geofilum rubicundum JCM 15548 TaxID=1236989 RepID=A0A0E9LRA8_9BACT|nr:ATP-binding cassette domain-containing protein [Geofilum rubicundum]GAO27789.1 ABC transporter [Geofilum rubicundum JCM 15548]
MIEVADIHKKFKEVNALDGVSFQVNKGELFGVIGPDGAGKTTLFRLIISLMLPDSVPSDCGDWIRLRITKRSAVSSVYAGALLAL